MKGMNALGVGSAMHDMWCSFDDPVAVGADAKRFDQHVSAAALSWEHSVYKEGFTGGDKADLAKLLRCQLHNFCAGYTEDGKVKYETEGVRCSGDMNTGLGNCLLACGIVWSYGHERKINIRLANNGDDCVVFMERRDLDRFMTGFFDYCKTLGFHMEMEKPVYRFEHIEFCQGHPVLTGHGYTMVRNFPTSISKDLISILPLNDQNTWMKWANDVGMCGQALTAGVPILYEFYTVMTRSGKGSFGKHSVLDTGAARAARGMDKRRIDISPDTRVSFYDAFGVTPDMQVAIEAKYYEQTFAFGVTLPIECNIDFLNKPILHNFQTHFDESNYDQEY
jgi:hypothetical protein